MWAVNPQRCTVLVRWGSAQVTPPALFVTSSVVLPSSEFIVDKVVVTRGALDLRIDLAHNIGLRVVRILYSGPGVARV